jgi:uncharacterized membrane protein
MSERGLRMATAVLAVAGAALTSYLLYVRQTGASLTCASGGCGTVQSSRYSEVFGVPLASVGFLAYSTLLATAIARGEPARLAQAVVALAAAGFSTYLLYVQAGVIGAVCDWCLVSDGLMTGLATLALLRLHAVPAHEPAVSSSKPAESA